MQESLRRDHATDGWDVIDSTDLYGDGAGVLNAPDGYYYSGFIPAADTARFTSDANATTYRTSSDLGDGSFALVGGVYYPMIFRLMTVSAGTCICIKVKDHG